MENTLTRIKKFLDSKGISARAFETSVGMSNGSFSAQLKNNKTIGVDKIENILQIYQEINPIWLLTGKGSMLREVSEPDRIVVEKATNFSLELKQEHQLPVLEPEAVGGFGNNAFSFSEQDVTDYYVIPDFDKRKVDFIIRLTGHSMEPKFLHGDKLACKIIKENSFIEWNKPHIIATRDRGFILKRIRKSSNDLNMLMVSEDPNYEPFEVPKEEITGIALVVGVIRVE